MASSRSAGFSLLEAIVALAILAAAGLALFAATAQSMQMISRAENARHSDAALRSALDFLETVNPMESPSGEHDLGDFLLRWHASEVEAPQDGATGSLQPGFFQVGLYDVRLELWRDGAVVRQASLRRAGFRQVREPPPL